MITDTTFFTNEPGYALFDRFKKTLKRGRKDKALYYNELAESCLGH